MASNAVEKIVLRVLTLIVSIPIAKAVRKAIDGVWQAARPDNPPRLAGDTKVKAADAITWAALSAAGIVAGELLTRAASETAYRAVMGTEPPASSNGKKSKKAKKQDKQLAKAVRVEPVTPTAS